MKTKVKEISNGFLVTIDGEVTYCKSKSGAVRLFSKALNTPRTKYFGAPAESWRGLFKGEKQ